MKRTTDWVWCFLVCLVVYLLSIWHVHFVLPSLISRELRSQLVSIIHLTVSEQEQGMLGQLQRLQRQVDALAQPPPRRWWQR